MQVAAEMEGVGWGAFKPRLAEALVEALKPPAQRYKELRAAPVPHPPPAHHILSLPHPPPAQHLLSLPGCRLWIDSPTVS